MKKRLSVICSLALSVVLLAGCVSAPQNSSEIKTPAAPESSDDSQSTTVVPVDVNVMALKGPTAMGMVQFMNESDAGNITDHHYHFTITAMTDEVSAALAQGTADIAAVPANLASVLYHTTKGDVQVLALNTLGVLYIVESGETITSMEDLRGKTIYASGKGGTPEYALNYLLTQNGIDPTGDVTIEWKSEQAECLTALTTQENAVAMLPQPFVTTAQSKSDSIRVALDLTAEWNKIQSGSEAPSTLVTGVVVARTAFVEEHPEAVDAFMDYYETSVAFVNDHVEEAAVLVGGYGIVTEEVAAKAIPACNIVFVEGDEMKEKLSGYLSVLLEQNPKSVGGSLPDDDFFYHRQSVR